MKCFGKSLIFLAGIPFLSSLVGLGICLFGLELIGLLTVPALTIAIYIYFRKSLDFKLGVRVNGITLLALTGIFTVMMVLASGNLEGVIMSNFSWFLIPFGPVLLVTSLMGTNFDMCVIAFSTYALAFLTCMILGKIRVHKRVLALAAAFVLICGAADTYLYLNRPSVKYAGHGFDYMNGFSSTDFSDYMVYSENSKLVELDHVPDLVIENEADMPKLDGAEACYPLYAALAKAVYKDIDRIEAEYKETDTEPWNGKIVTFSNTLWAFDRLLMADTKDSDYDQSIDMFFGARPSANQLAEAESCGVELEITTIGKEGFVFFVEEDNPVENLTSEQVRAIYSGEITNWKEVGGKDQVIRAFQRPANSGSQTMMEYFMGDIPLKEAETYEIVGAMEGVIREVAQYANEDGAMGYSFRYFLEELNQEKGVKILSIDGVYPSVENIRNGTYPLTVSLCLVTRKNDPNPYVQKMIDFILSEDGQYIIEQTGYAPKS